MLVAGTLIYLGNNRTSYDTLAHDEAPADRVFSQAPMARWSSHYLSVDSLIGASDIIITGRVVGSEPQRKAWHGLYYAENRGFER